MNQEKKTAIQYMQEILNKFRILMQLPPLEPEYIVCIQMELRARKWRLSDFKKAVDSLMQDEKYAAEARFGKYPTIQDFLRVRSTTASKAFYAALARYLQGDWWEKETVLNLATGPQLNALTLAGGLGNLYDRAHADYATPINKLLDLVAENEGEAPVEIIDEKRQLAAPITAGDAIQDLLKGMIEKK